MSGDPPSRQAIELARWRFLLTLSAHGYQMESLIGSIEVEHLREALTAAIAAARKEGES